MPAEVPDDSQHTLPPSAAEVVSAYADALMDEAERQASTILAASRARRVAELQLRYEEATSAFSEAVRRSHQLVDGVTDPGVPSRLERAEVRGAPPAGAEVEVDRDGAVAAGPPAAPSPADQAAADGTGDGGGEAGRVRLIEPTRRRSPRRASRGRHAGEATAHPRRARTLVLELAVAALVVLALVLALALIP